MIAKKGKETFKTKKKSEINKKNIDLKNMQRKS